MKKIQMIFMGNVEEFLVTYECEEYVFCQCLTDPSHSGFFTAEYLKKFKQ